jgi:hypothetical protein
VKTVNVITETDENCSPPPQHDIETRLLRATDG